MVGGELLVAHDLADVDPTRTMESLYLDPLRAIVKANGGSVHPGDDGRFQLLVDVKSEAVSTYRALHRTLREYPDIMTRWVGGQPKQRAVDAVVSGNRALEVMTDQRVRYAGYDGRLADLDSGPPPTVMPLVSDNWTNHFSWTGDGPMPADERARLRALVATAHDNGYLVRIWATPDEPGEAREAVWQELVDAGVDYLNTDDLAGLQDFLTARAPARLIGPAIRWLPTGNVTRPGESPAHERGNVQLSKRSRTVMFWLHRVAFDGRSPC